MHAMPMTFTAAHTYANRCRDASVLPRHSSVSIEPINTCKTARVVPARGRSRIRPTQPPAPIVFENAGHWSVAESPAGFGRTLPLYREDRP